MARDIEQAPDRTTPEQVDLQSGLAHTGEFDGAAQRAFKTVKLGAVALAAVAAGYAGLAYVNSKQDYERLVPHKPVPGAVTTMLRVGGWNMQDRAADKVADIMKIMSHEHLDMLALQEVSGNDASYLSTVLPYSTQYILADRKQHPLEGGYGNMLITNRPLSDVSRAYFQGTTTMQTATGMASGAVKDLVAGNLGFPTFKDGRQETRGAVAGSLQVPDAITGKNTEVRVITTHLAGGKFPAIHRAQFGKLLQFADKNTKDERPTVFCGDLNASEGETAMAFSNIRFTTVHDPSQTSVKNKVAIDHCTYFNGNRLGYVSHARILRQYETDHYAYVADLPIQPQDAAVPYMAKMGTK